MNSILWSQGETPIEGSSFVIDGIVQDKDSVESNQIAYDKLIAQSNLSVFQSSAVRLLYKFGYIKSGQFKVTFKKGQGIFFSSVYKSVDEANRNIAYMFYCKTDDIDIAIKQFKNDSKKINREFLDSEIDSLKILFKLKQYYLFGLLILIVLICLGLIGKI